MSDFRENFIAWLRDAHAMEEQAVADWLLDNIPSITQTYLSKK
ncbi:hypothetical protein [Serratia quinivorans]